MNSDSPQPPPHVNVSADVRTPISLAVGFTLAIIAVLMILGASIGGSYLLIINSDNNLKAYEQSVRHKDQVVAKQIAAREAVANLRAGLPTCEAIVKMDDASHGAKNASSSPQSYGHRLARAVHAVAVSSHCAEVVDEYHHGWSLTRILKQQEKEGHAPR